MSKNNNFQWKKDETPLRTKRAILMFGPLVVIFVGFCFYLLGGRYVSTENAYIKNNKTLISSQISGKALNVNVQNNSFVKKGDTLFVIDAKPFEIASKKAKAIAEQISTEIISMQAEYLKAEAQLKKAEENVDYLSKEYELNKKLALKGAASIEAKDKALYELKVAIAEKESVYQGLASIKAKLNGDPNLAVEDHPSYKQANADFEKAELELSYINVLAPSTGIVANLYINPGEYVVTGNPIFAIIDNKTAWVEVNLKETNLTYIRPGQEAKVQVDAYPGETWKAKVASIAPATGSEFSILPAQNSSGNWVKVTQRIMVRLELEEANNKPMLAAGMSAYVKIDTGANRLQKFFSK